MFNQAWSRVKQYDAVMLVRIEDPWVGGGVGVVGCSFWSADWGDNGWPSVSVNCNPNFVNYCGPKTNLWVYCLTQYYFKGRNLRNLMFGSDC